MKHFTSILGRSAIVAGLGLGAFAIAALADWSNPPASPPSCPSSYDSCNAPLNVGASTQTKTGSIVTAGLGITSSNFIFKPSASAVTAGAVLTAGDTAGTVTWGAAGSSGGGTPSKIISLDYGGGADSSGQSYTPSAGVYSITIPSGVTRIRVRSWGAGGGGGEGGGAWGGGGGEYAESLLTVTPGSLYTVRVGAAGTGGQSPINAGVGTAGGDTTFSLSGTTLLKASGGWGGCAMPGPCGQGGGQGNGVPGGNNPGLGQNLIIGGDAVGADNGGSGTDQRPSFVSGGSSPNGGSGGALVVRSCGTYRDGKVPGGGGAGHNNANPGCTGANGGNGAAGRLIIEY